jgi:Cu2+-exporting ATPase
MANEFCCNGCEAVYGLLHREGLDRYYDLAAGKRAPVPETSGLRSYSWLEPLVERSEATSGSLCSLELDVQGVHCAACVWLMNELFRREEGGASLTVNPGLGKVRLAWRKGAFDVERFLARVEGFGYLFGPSRKTANEQSRSLLLRIGATFAISGNVMLFSLAFYVGLTPEDGEIYQLFTRLSVLLSSLVVGIGGWPFFRSAWRALRHGVLHLDLPIAMGILLAFGASLYQARGGRGDLYYFDTLNVFVLLMLVGRWLQHRVREKDQRVLREDHGAEGSAVRRREGGRSAFIQAPQIRKGDHLLGAPGDLVPVDGQLLQAGSFTTDWITGEPDLLHVELGGDVPAGAFNAGRHAVALLAGSDFEESPLPSLLRSADTGAKDGRVSHLRFWDVFARVYVSAVLLIATAGLLLWLPSGVDKALQVTVALLVVTCPCAIGIAMPLAYELAQARLRRDGLFVRRRELLDKLPRVRKVLFDKTGTLTLGRLRLVRADGLDHLPQELLSAAFDLSSRSNHPVSRCLAPVFERHGAHFSPDADVREIPGMGMELHQDGKVIRLGRASWASPGSGDDAATVLSVDGVAAARFHTEESVRAGAKREIAALREEGKEVWLISGDAQDKVAAMASSLGIPHALGGMRPEDKEAFVRSIDQGDTLFVGDGVNDSLAFEQAFVAGTPAVDRPVLPSKSDFFLLGEGIGGIREVMALSEELQTTVRRRVAIALAYNLLAIGVSLVGWMTPLRAAIAMPASSVLILAFTVSSLRAKRRWEPAPTRKELVVA